MNCQPGFQIVAAIGNHIEALADFKGIPANADKNQHRFRIHADRKRPLIVMDYRDRVELILEPGRCIDIYCRADTSQGSRLLFAVYIALIMALQQQEASLFYGAVVARSDKSLILCGLPGAGKTTLLLHLLRNSWRYLSDNTFLMKDGTAHVFRRKIGFNHYHLKTYPWLFEDASLKPVSAWKAGLRRLARQMHRYPGFKELKQLRQFYDPSIKYEPNQLFPQCEVLDNCKPRSLILMRPGTDYAFEPMGREAAHQKLALLLALSMADYTEPAQHWSYCLDRQLYDFVGGVQNSLAGFAYFSLTVPQTMEVRDLHRAFERDVQQQVFQNQASTQGEFSS